MIMSGHDLGKSKLVYLKDNNVATHSVDSDAFNVVIHLSARSKT